MMPIQMRAIMLAISWASVSLTLTAGASRAALPPQAEKQQDATEKQGGPQAEEKEMVQPKQHASIPDQGPVPRSQHGFLGLGKDLLLDQKQIWTSPARVRFSDAQWLVPISGIAAGLMVTDREYSKHLSQNPSTISRYNNLSNVSVFTLIGGAGGMWLLSHATRNDHWRETGLVAGVIAHEYPGPLTKLLVYGLAATVDFSRVRARQHFPSDVFVGSVIGNLVAQNIYSRHHDPELGGEAWRSISQTFRGDGSSSPANIGSPY